MAQKKTDTYAKKSKKTSLPVSRSKPVSTKSSEESLLPTISSPALAPDISPKDRNLLSLYMNEVGRTPLLNPEEERALAIRFYESHDKESFQKLVQANLRFVVKIAFEFSRYGAKVLDLIQEGNVGLLKAVQDFNPYKDVRLTTYAVWWIRSYIQDYLLRNWSVVRIGTTAAQKKLFYRLKKEQQKLELAGIKPEPKAIAMNLGVEESDVKMMQERLSGGDISLSSPSGQDQEEVGFTLINRVADETPLASEQLESSEQGTLFHQALQEFVLILEERDQKIFNDRLLSEKPKTLLEIGEEHGFSKERARQIEERLKDRLKEFLSEKYPDISLK